MRLIVDSWIIGSSQWNSYSRIFHKFIHEMDLFAPFPTQWRAFIVRTLANELVIIN